MLREQGFEPVNAEIKNEASGLVKGKWSFLGKEIIGKMKLLHDNLQGE